MAKRGNPFTSDAPANRKAWTRGTLDGQSAVKVAAHERKRPVRNKRVEDQNPDNSFAAAAEGPTGAQNVSGLQRPGDKAVNHLAGAVALLNRKRV